MKCPNCPVVGPTCTGEISPRACLLGQTRKDYARYYREQAGEIEPRPLPTAEEIAEINQCPYRSCQSGCLQARCEIGKGRDGNVDAWECIDCLRETVQRP